MLKNIAYSVVFLTILCLYSWSIYHSSTGGHKLGSLSKALVNFASFPQTIKEVLKSNEVKSIPPTYLPFDANDEYVNDLDYDLFGVASFWNDKLENWEIKMFNFKNDSIVHTWFIGKKDYQLTNANYANCRPKHAVVLKDKQVVFMMCNSANLIRMDSSSNILWQNKDLKFHHSINLNAENNLWVCSMDKNDKKGTGGIVKNLDENLISYKEDYITKIDVETGNILFKKGVAKILMDNGYKSILLGGDLKDPIHLNDIQPVLEDSKYWKKGDVFISARNRSLVMLYRPSTNKIINLIQGPFVNQHDVDIKDVGKISIFNNNYIVSRGFSCDDPYMEIDSLNNSEILIYDFKDSSYIRRCNNMMQLEKIMTYTGGLAEELDNGDYFVEAKNFGKYYVINEDGLVMKKVLFTPDSNFIYLPSWTRVYETLPF